MSPRVPYAIIVLQTRRGRPRASEAVAAALELLNSATHAALDQSRSACTAHVAAGGVYNFTITWPRRCPSSALLKSAPVWHCRRSLVLARRFDASRRRSACAAHIASVLSTLYWLIQTVSDLRTRRRRPRTCETVAEACESLLVGPHRVPPRTLLRDL